MSRACHVPFILHGTYLDGKDKHESGTMVDVVEIEYSVHTLHPIIERHCKHIFPGVAIKGGRKKKTKTTTAATATATTTATATATATGTQKTKCDDKNKGAAADKSEKKAEGGEVVGGAPQYPLLCIPTFQHTCCDMLEFTESAEKEKDLKLKGFYAWCQAVCQRLIKKGYWADYIDPCSGYPVLGGSGSSTYNEVEGMQLLLRYRFSQVGMCKVILHPRWGQRIYPASMFAMAPVEEITKAIKEVEDTFKFNKSTNDSNAAGSSGVEQQQPNNNSSSNQGRGAAEEDKTTKTSRSGSACTAARQQQQAGATPTKN
eukprot:CAMPEP_0170191778 /NCGR_PEP_ID=MMETSP0040_2-20121228/52497_1 /TAXON_ID=641309 /ORGANISM="Lotharella oceanica, Strain CCMP622" /LENGTH=315 /DNA_ID=CAMNT_0010439933 /DNA_START=72 /DNA_END=1019 /DNA_ORIENTATION=+